MTDYIKRESRTFIEIADDLNDLVTELNDKIVETIREKNAFAKSADVAPVRHGCWQITDAYPHNVYCSECHTKCAQTHWAVWEDGSLPRRYCPNCGARMDERKDNEID